MSDHPLPFDLQVITTRKDPRTDRLLKLANITSLVSFDTEFVSTEPTNITLLQFGVKVEGNIEVFVFDLEKIGEIERPLKNLLNSEEIVKVGCGLISDIDRLDRHQIRYKSFLELQLLARSLGFPRCGLDELSTTLLRDRKMVISYDRRKPEDPKLEVVYAAYDAYLTLESYLALLVYRHPLNSLEKSSGIPEALGTLDINLFWRWALPYIQARDGYIRLVDLLSLVLQGYSIWNARYPRIQIIRLYDEMMPKLVDRELISLENDIISIRNGETDLPPIPKNHKREMKPHSLQKAFMQSKRPRYTEPPRKGLYPKALDRMSIEESDFPPLDKEPSPRQDHPTSRADQASSWRSRKY